MAGLAIIAWLVNTVLSIRHLYRVVVSGDWDIDDKKKEKRAESLLVAKKKIIHEELAQSDYLYKCNDALLQQDGKEVIVFM
mmetsp:Transcript_7390/g.11126  ORF Transcript_7390/g.11126 Transcript_7390/m.11126 type:complete len:81 (+) Transcript_7390:3-245(+)